MSTRITAVKTAILGLSILAAVGLAPEAKAQFTSRMSQFRSQAINAGNLDRAEWHRAPREIQLIDDRPIVRDFREAPAPAQMIELPPPPQGFAGPYRSTAGGAVGDGYGRNPSNGIPLQGAPGLSPYRADLPGMGGRLPLEKAGFGNHTNIPAGGMAPHTALPQGTTTGVHATLMTPTRRQVVPALGPAYNIALAPNRAPSAPAASYGGDYTRPAAGKSMGGGSHSKASVSGVLLTRLRGN